MQRSEAEWKPLDPLVGRGLIYGHRITSERTNGQRRMVDPAGDFEGARPVRSGSVFTDRQAVGHGNGTLYRQRSRANKTMAWPGMVQSSVWIADRYLATETRGPRKRHCVDLRPDRNRDVLFAGMEPGMGLALHRRAAVLPSRRRIQGSGKRRSAERTGSIRNDERGRAGKFRDQGQSDIFEVIRPKRRMSRGAKRSRSRSAG